MVRGLRPRNRIRWAADARFVRRGKRGCGWPGRTAASNAARRSRERGASRTPPLTGGRKTTASASRKTDAQTPQTSTHALGSPERGAVAALCAVTEGLVRRRCGRTNVIRQPRPGGRGSPPLRGVGRWARGTGAVGRPTAAHRGRCALRRVRKVSALQIRCPSSRGRGVEDAAPYGSCERVCFSGAVR